MRIFVLVGVLLMAATVARATPSEDLAKAYSAEDAGDHAAAVRLFTKALDAGGFTDHTRALAFMGRGVAHTNNAEFQEALDDFSMAIMIEPALWDAYYDRARVYSDVGSYSQSLNDFAAIEGVAARYPEYFTYRGYVHYENMDFPDAEADLTRAIAQAPKEVDAYYHRARTYSAQDKREEAVADFGMVIQLADDENSMKPSAIRWRGTITYALKQYDRAISDFSTLLKADPDDADARSRRARAYYAQGEYQAAIDDATVLIHPGVAGAQVAPWPGVVESERPFADRIVEQYNSTMRLPGDDPYAYVIRARAELQLGKKDDALADYQAAIGFIPPGADPSVPAEMDAARQWTPFGAFMTKYLNLLLAAAAIFIAGILGGAYFFWRQRQVRPSAT